ncbi:RidA family protein [Arthrobacter dokdonensis]|uniref:RidA family protein n=1 Tax=Arthrobacter dokdonellae TaxID=2211210 RepID=UPI000DE57E31|nr:RidA family protein [Arthrobacter dokdonellae]
MSKRAVTTSQAPVPVASYSQAVVVGETVYLAGQGGFNASTRELVGRGIGEQTRQAFGNLAEVLSAAGGTLDDLVSVSVYLADDAEFEGMNEVYGDMFSAPYPARTTVAAGLGPGMRVEIDGVAVLGCAPGKAST